MRSILSPAAVLLPLLAGRGRADATCAPVPSPFPTYQQLPDQSTMPDPLLPLAYTVISSANFSAADVMAGRGQHRVQTPEEWFQCRQPEIMQLLQTYQYGFYPDHAQETVTATRSGNTVSIQVTAGGKTGKFRATVSLPSGASATKPAPVVINIGGMQNAPYIAAGIAVVGFDYTSVAADSNSKTGAFWDVYKGRDIGVLTAWAWGFHRTLDALNMTVPEIDPTRVGVTGCSRLGKGALAAGLFDTRITVTMPMSSGVQGMGPYRYHAMSGQDETLENSKQGAGWWSDSTLGTFENHAENLPYDAHTIGAAIAPRALIIDQGTGDQFTNSKATALIVYPAAKAVYDWLGVGDKIGMSVRGGGHCDMSGYTSVLPFVEKIFFNKTPTKDYNNLGTYGSPLTTAYPWATLMPKA
ncbi:carbohydrate esterase family 15 protein [Niveomyces insectorum RCEF 264]|uniref:(4-O-methyl)-D-glucuronate--lignin esterase n=1 Tax=Niveomyces insectorum RCEF 264 TaxID=1081102 RepID=A0A167VPP1_9HYPO|nr:carbohydrate esterase family 15 protein [Niveomyces insectorum RCEF 264]